MENNNTSQTNIQTSGESSDFMKVIQEKLLNQSGMVSSSTSELESKLSKAIAGYKSSTDLSNKAVESSYQREKSYMLEGANNEMIAGRAAGTGGLMNMAALRSLTETTDKSLKDLSMRKEELILQNNAEAAAKIADLEFKTLEFKQNAQQKVFENLLGLGNFGLQGQQEARMAKAQSFQERQAVSDIALNYGLKIEPGDTLDSITGKAMVFASEEQKLRLAKMRAEINYTNTQAAKISEGDNTAEITPAVTATLATRWNQLSAQGLTVDSSAEMSNILGKYAKAGKEDEFYKAIAEQAVAQAKEQSSTTKASKDKTTFGKQLLGLGEDIRGGTSELLRYFTGTGLQ